ncbi:YceI family protein [Paraflavisolibacter sp. H34]|uniref:YceI family protein n=1 Tax=Huijunlia imazamoxiresistens TaxID=3127457 RepID=UPI003019AA07
MNAATIFFPVLLLLSAAPDTAVKTIRADKKTSTITYHMSHPLHSFKATSRNVDAVIEYDEGAGAVRKVAVLAKVSSFDSDNSNRDSHMLEATEALKYPNVTFSSTSVSEANHRLTVQGVLNFHGVGKNISFDASEQDVKGHRIVTGGFTVLLTDHKIDRPSLLMMPVDNEMKVDFKMDFPLQAK